MISSTGPYLNSPHFQDAVIVDPYFKVAMVARTPSPNKTAWFGMHQCYSEESVIYSDPPSEGVAGRACVKHLLAGERGHFGPLEHPQITFAVAGYPHNVMQQARTHRIGVSFDVQSSRYTGARMERLRLTPGGSYGREDPGLRALDIEQLIYFRPPGHYRDRQGDPYDYTHGMREADKLQASYAIEHYILNRKTNGLSEEHARGGMPTDFRQDFVVSFSLRALLHFLNVRGKKDAQPEIRQLCVQMLPHLHYWSPEFFNWFMESLWLKGKLAP